jgi:peptidoglycan hydrolase-like protein with peptidoglycan-binding domain
VDARYRYAKELEAELEQVGTTLPAEETGTTPTQADPSPAAVPAAECAWPPRTICNGINGDDTAVLQAVLKARGYPVNYVDGAFGAYLEDIVKDFQKATFPDEPAEWDGIVGPKTWAKLLER